MRAGLFSDNCPPSLMVTMKTAVQESLLIVVGENQHPSLAPGPLRILAVSRKWVLETVPHTEETRNRVDRILYVISCNLLVLFTAWTRTHG